MAETWYDKEGKAVNVTGDSKIGIFQGLGGGAVFWDREKNVAIGAAYKTTSDADYWMAREKQAIANNSIVLGPSAGGTTEASFTAALTAAQIAAGQLPLPPKESNIALPEANEKNGNAALKQKRDIVFRENGVSDTPTEKVIIMTQNDQTPAKNDAAVSLPAMTTDKLVLVAAAAVIGYLLFAAGKGGK